MLPSLPHSSGPSTELIDSHGRVLRDLRISVTDRCNFRCVYCLPETEAAQNFYRGRWAQMPNSKPIVHEWAPRAHLLTFEEMARVVRIAAKLGIRKIRLTGGEPLLRRNLPKLVAMISSIEGIDDLALTTNGFLFPEQARDLRAAGLKRVTLSLDSQDPKVFHQMTGNDGLARVLESLRLARELGFHPIKMNAVIIKDLNDHEVESLAEFAHNEDLSFRFIEFMPLDSARAWQRELVIPGREILSRLMTRFALQPVASDNASETARRWRFPDGRGEIGIIAPVSEPFCGHCNRLRLTADGKIRTCLFSVVEHDLRERLRADVSDPDIASYLQRVVWGKEARHHIGEPDFVSPPRSMSCIGG